MTGADLREAITSMGLTQVEFARLVEVSVGAVAQWLSGARSIPGPVESFVSLFQRLPSSIRETELQQLRKGSTQMKNAMYLITFTGDAGTGMATLTFQDGLVYGFDEAGAKYDGSYAQSDRKDHMFITAKVAMPPNQPSVIGGHVFPVEWILEVSGHLPIYADTGTLIADTNAGSQLTVKFQRMRDLPDVLQAA
ncbi:helix-turn-helix domain-containing protein [Rhizobium ruizarguesonis]|uniref:helix-turn-helix domain-containing protein n=1 Tax=Rhizobium ruizarguesonis TaxID=2081791 RepID=UPI00102FCAD9|nr:helix-turn-helix domain-containing protein [Rhizobium ruizarguesonis]TBA50499.1 hypothetical protein ELH63_23900 [Rhizobium ruizarguesonis]